MADDANVKVFCRVRPPNERERGAAARAHKCVSVPATDAAQQTLFLQPKHAPARTFTFDRVFGEAASQTDVFRVVGAPITQACLEGYNGTIFAYGQTGSGKTFTMQGPDAVIDDADTRSLSQEQLALRGLVPRVFDYLFDNVVAVDDRKNVQHTFACSFLEIYNERVYDLLDGGSAKDAAGLQLRENGRKGVHVEGLIESVVTNPKKAAELMTVGAQNRRVGQTSMNRESSRSHSVFILQMQSKETSAEGTKIRTSRFNLVDLAGSERQRSTDAAGERLKEAGSINKSLSALGNVILGLSEQSVGKHRHVHYRDSKLTFLLKDSLGGNSKTFMIATISPAEDSAFETLSTLKFAQRAKMIQNSAVVNEDSVGSALFLQEEIKRLRRQLQQAHQEIARNIPGSNLILQESARSETTLSQESVSPSTQQLGPCDPATDNRFRELEESFASIAEKNDRLLRSCEYLQLQNGNFEALCTELKKHIAHLKMMLRLRGIGGPETYNYKPSADAIEWRMKYEEMEERFIELQEELQRSGIDASGATGKIKSEVENMNMMLLGLTKQLAFVLRDKHDLQDRLLENQSEKDETMEGFSSQEVVDADFSARLEEALKQQANEYQAKVDSIASVNACLEEKAAETSLELLQIKEREASWLIQQHDLEKELTNSKATLQRSEEDHLLSKEMLVQEKIKVYKLGVQLERAREGARLEFETALADAASTNRELENARKLLQHQLGAVTADLKQREHQIEEAKKAFAQLKAEVTHLEEANRRSVSQLGKTRDELKQVSMRETHLQAEISDRDDTIDELKHSEAAVAEEKMMLEQKLDASTKFIRQLEEDAAALTRKHDEVIDSLQHEAEEDARKLVEDFEKQLCVKDEQYQRIRSDFNDYQADAEERDRLHKVQLEEKEMTLSALQHQLDNQKQEARLAVEDLQQKLSKALADISRLSEEKDQVVLERASAVDEIRRIQSDLDTLNTEKDVLTSELWDLSERSKQLSVKNSKLEDQNAKLQKRCEQQLAQLSESADIIKNFTQKVTELEEEVATKSNEAVDLRKDLASAQEESRQAAVMHAQQLDDLAASSKKNEELEQELLANKNAMDEISSKLDKATGEIREAEAAASQQQEEIKMYKGIQSTLRDEVRKLEFDRLELAEFLKTEQESKQNVEQKFAKAEREWEEEKDKLTQKSQKSISALEKRVGELSINEESLSAQKRELEHEINSLKTSVNEKDNALQELMTRIKDREDKIQALEWSTADSAATQDQLAGTVDELQTTVRDLERQLADKQSAASEREAEIASKVTAISDRDDIISSLKERLKNDEAAWNLKARKYQAELESSRSQVQAFEQLVAEKTEGFAKAQEALHATNSSLKQKIEEGENILAQQTEQLMQEIKQLGLSIEEKDKQLQVAERSLAELKDQLTRSTEGDTAKLQDLQAAIKELNAKHESVVAENTSLKTKAVSELKKQEEELSRRRSEIGAAEEQIKSDGKALEEQKVSTLAAETALTEAKAKDALGQAKRKLLTEKVKLQREVQSLTKKLEFVSKENEKLVGHHNSRQKIQHHVKVKEENNRLLDQVRQLTEDKAKLQRAFEKLRAMLKEKENIGVEAITNTPSSVSPASSASSLKLPPKKIKRPSLGSASSATAGTAASAARAAARLAARGRPISRSASPGPPTKKRVRTHSSSSGPGWQR
ncbi:unnamed protein product [Phytophthora lilii]|uniref:Unnamed protein product n=1 Tax=Phytophthora lilii TaxID=2077276 RepID=A0A9W6WZV1_9STRA|nr:unnamed protein product [Phytophthora lilii]